MAPSRKSLAAGAVGVAAVALIASSSSVTGAYFSEAKDGTITGTTGAVHVDTSPMNFAWNDMMPGEQKTATVTFRNKGTGPQDFYLVFNNVPALHALNNLGTYGEVHVTGGETGNIAPLFDSFNLQDGRTRADGSNSCGVFAQANLGCWPLPESLKLASNVAREGTGSLTFSFNYAGKLGGKLPNGDRVSGGTGGVFNAFPSTGPNSEAFGTDAAGTAGNGLPYQIVAVQVGQKP